MTELLRTIIVHEGDYDGFDQGVVLDFFFLNKME
jgi:hypothetical protein